MSETKSVRKGVIVVIGAGSQSMGRGFPKTFSECQAADLGGIELNMKAIAATVLSIPLLASAKTIGACVSPWRGCREMP